MPQSVCRAALMAACWVECWAVLAQHLSLQNQQIGLWERGYGSRVGYTLKLGPPKCKCMLVVDHFSDMTQQ